MKILHVIPWIAPRYGGPPVSVLEASAALTERGHSVEIVTTNADGRDILDVPTGEVTAWAGAAVTFHPLSPPRWYATSWPMLADLRRRVSTFDIVHVHYLYRFHGPATVAAARSRGVPYVIQAHGSLDRWHRTRKRLAKDLYHALVEDPILRGASGIVCTSHREQSHVRELGYQAPTWVIPVGIDAEDLRAGRDPNFRARAGIGDDRRLVAFLGRISAKKGVDRLVESFRDIAATVPLAHLVVAGPDDEGIGRRLEPKIASMGLAERISFTGSIQGSEKRALLQEAEVFVLPSADESFGVAVAEAMSVGCPVVVSPDVAIQDVVESSRAGLVVEREPIAIAQAVTKILANATMAAAMGEAGRRAVDEQFASPVVAREMESMYEAIVNLRRKARPRSRDSHKPVTGSSGSLFVCPRCRGSLRRAGSESSCDSCAWAGSTVDGIEILLPDTTLAEHDELDHQHAGEGKRAQAEFFDRADEEEFETERPHGSPRMYRFLLGEKFRRALSPVRPHLAGSSALAVCGGSGMDAEYLARAGATVISSDLSLGAALRARSRSQRYGLGFASVVADVERLPFPDRSIDLVAVHDGLHHLTDPTAGLAEMARVARRWVIITEPARASVTRLATRVGLALEREEAGNRVARMDPTEVSAFLEARGFSILRASRYAMYYRHHPGAAFGFLSIPFVFPIARAAWRLANGLLGRFGNKMVVVAERVSHREPPSGAETRAIQLDDGAVRSGDAAERSTPARSTASLRTRDP